MSLRINKCDVLRARAQALVVSALHWVTLLSCVYPYNLIHILWNPFTYKPLNICFSCQYGTNKNHVGVKTSNNETFSHLFQIMNNIFQKKLLLLQLYVDN